MKVSQSFVVVSLSVAAQTQLSMATPVPDAGDLSFDSPLVSEAVLTEELPTRLVPKGFGKRAHPSLLSLNPRARAVSLSLNSNGRVNQRAHAQADRSKLQNSIHIGDGNILNASLGAHRPLHPLLSSDEHGLRTSLLDLSLKMKRSADEPSIPGIIQVVTGDVNKPVSDTLSNLPGVVNDLSALKKVLPVEPGVTKQLTGILGARALPTEAAPALSALPLSSLPLSSLPLSSLPLSSLPLSSLPLSGLPLSGLPLSSLPLVSELSKSLPAGSPLSALPVAAPSTGLPIVGSLPILGSILSARSELADPSMAVLGGLSPPESLPTNHFNPDLLSASDIMAAGGAFPIQPSHSLDGQTLPNEPSIPNFSQLFADAQAIQSSGGAVSPDAVLRSVKAPKKHKGSKSHHEDKTDDDSSKDESSKGNHEDAEDEDSSKAHHEDKEVTDSPKSQTQDKEDDEAALMKKLLEKLNVKALVPAPSVTTIEAQVPAVQAVDAKATDLTSNQLPDTLSPLTKKIPKTLKTPLDDSQEDDIDYIPGPKLHRTRTVINFPHRK
ncbi:hypothetical protein PTTG_06664 [Puccinia triticina 1-1 BBBD Race 1]|uniref:Uncharacterized protein n=2 Tax=Puccinia triticina TaxID=208348 RepID=A0A0C4F0P7_PUCT1|nr:uncharacterized protein PtA15_8A744 [Puccinia triticina]OAV99476.1 hypothetical protein PTTG_06664 [Puccinia triticina 1-1 BBBD Race 1]WAQ87837.1 hypothetical protein PtA15_8A744 [Puccinia triticina]WAR57714.1 hypothetical protein PtB15_8B767 [Puccinia triticina]